MHCKQFFSIFFIVILSACSSIKDTPVESIPLNQTINERNQQLSKLNSWTIAGKIAFINSKERHSASLHWQKKSCLRN